MAHIRAPVAFGTFVLDPARRLLTRSSGEPVTIGAKAFDALTILVEHAGEVVSRRALSAALWPSGVVVDNNVTQVIRALRQTLRDPHHCYVATVPRRGYQFVAKILEPSSSAAAETSSFAQAAPTMLSEARTSPTRGFARQRRTVMVTAIAVVALNIVFAGALALTIYMWPSRMSASHNVIHRVAAECESSYAPPPCIYEHHAAAERSIHPFRKSPKWEEEQRKPRTKST